ncbi:MAG: hypothetical protein V1728_02440 [Candidatus Micrarchaeota archaeon]
MQTLMHKNNADFLAYVTLGEDPPRAKINLAISDETYQKLKKIIDSNIEKPFVDTGTLSEYEETRLKLNAIIRTVGRALNKRDDISRIKTPQELADEILNYYENRSSARVDSVCVDISLLTSEIIKRYFENLKKDTSILIFHLVDKNGLEYVHGHASAAILVGGWLVDPALQGEALDLGRIVPDREANGYKQFYAKLKENYSSVPGNPIFSNCVFVEFSQAKTDSELEAFYLLENAVRMTAPTNGTPEEIDAFYLQRDAAFIGAYKVSPGDYYAAIRAGDAYKHAGDIESARRAYLSAAANNPNLYLANALAALGLSNLQSPSSENDLLIANHLIHTAIGRAKKEELAPAYAYLYLFEIARKLGDEKEAEEAKALFDKLIKGQ